MPSSYARWTMAAVVSAPLSLGRLAIGAPPRLSRETRSVVRPSGTRSPGSGILPTLLHRHFTHVLGIALAFGSAAAWGCGDFLSGLMSRRLPLLTVLLFTQAAG